MSQINSKLNSEFTRLSTHGAQEIFKQYTFCMLEVDTYVQHQG